MKTGIWATAVWVGNGVNAGAMGEMGVLNCASNEVLVIEGAGGTVKVGLGTFV